MCCNPKCKTIILAEKSLDSLHKTDKIKAQNKSKMKEVSRKVEENKVIMENVNQVREKRSLTKDEINLIKKTTKKIL
jgi:hypothetical protein